MLLGIVEVRLFLPFFSGNRHAIISPFYFGHLLLSAENALYVLERTSLDVLAVA